MPSRRTRSRRFAFDLDTDEGYDRARYWSELAAEQGSAAAHARLATIYHEGLGVERDPKRAAAHWLTAAKAGHSGAQLAIGNAYIVGAGVPVDRVQAAYFLMLSARQDNELAYACLPRLLRELTPEEASKVGQISERLGFPLERAPAGSRWLSWIRGLWARRSS